MLVDDIILSKSKREKFKMVCKNCGRKTIGENLCPKCRKTVKVVKCSFCGKEVVRDKSSKVLVFECKDCKQN